METKQRWHYTDGEIRTLYRDAKDKREQLHIIAQLNERTELEVIEKLRGMGEVVDLSEKRGHAPRLLKPRNTEPVKVNNSIRNITKDEVRRIRELAARGLGAEAIKKRLHIGPNRLDAIRKQFDVGILPNGVWTPEKNRRFREMWEAGKTYAQMAAELGCCEPTVWRHAQYLGLSNKRVIPAQSKAKEERVERFHALWDKGLTYDQIAEVMGLSKSTIYNYAIKLDLKRRGKAWKITKS